jgi:cobyrinic acid a,c-diamide synthase
MTISAFILSGTHSGAGKTTASFAVMAALAQEGYAVQPFKIGPDFIDPGYHRLATGRTSINLDLWMMGWEGIRDDFERYAGSADVAIVEGMGALHDGENGTARGSAADFAHHLGLPVLLVVDVWGMTRSTAAVLRGFADLDPRVKVAGVLLNRAGSRKHYEMIRDNLPADLEERLVGYLLRDSRFAIPERHLGLLTVQENAAAADLRGGFLAAARETLDLDRLSAIFEIARRAHHPPLEAAPVSIPKVARIGVAQDAAFCFYYPENLRRLEEAGAELVPWSPLSDAALPPGLSGLYLGGGYPESFAAELSAHRGLHAEIRALAEHGVPIYAECGGMMVLCQALIDFDGRRHPMVGLLPHAVAMDRNRLAIRYVEVETTRESLLGPAGTRARGHEFHQSHLVEEPALGSGREGYRVTDSYGQASTEGFTRGNVLASYFHLHFASNLGIARSFVERCHAAALSATGQH